MGENRVPCITYEDMTEDRLNWQNLLVIPREMHPYPLELTEGKKINKVIKCMSEWPRKIRIVLSTGECIRLKSPLMTSGREEADNLMDNSSRKSYFPKLIEGLMEHHHAGKENPMIEGNKIKNIQLSPYKDTTRLTRGGQPSPSKPIHPSNGKKFRVRER